MAKYIEAGLLCTRPCYENMVVEKSDILDWLTDANARLFLPNKDDMKNKRLTHSTLENFNEMFDNLYDSIESKPKDEQCKDYNIMFRYMFYLRAHSTSFEGKGSKLLFYYFFEKMYNIFPKTCTKLFKVIPKFGYFPDLDKIANIMKYKYPEIFPKIYDVYLTYLNKDCIKVFGKNLKDVTGEEAKELNDRLKLMSNTELKDYKNKNNICLSLAAKWFNTKETKEYKAFISILYFGSTSTKYADRKLINKRINYALMVFRKIISTLRQLLEIVEVKMCEQNPEGRRWGDIEIDKAPAGCIIKNRNAMLNQILNKKLSKEEEKTGNRHPHNKDRIACRNNLIKTTKANKLKGASLDICKLSDIIYGMIIIDRRIYPSKFIIDPCTSDSEREIINAIWQDMVKVNSKTICEKSEELRKQAEKEGRIDTWFDPLDTVLPIIDTSGSMVDANVLSTAIGLGIFISQISRGKLKDYTISFSNEPKATKLSGDVFQKFIDILNGPVGYSTDFDKTYGLVLEMMKKYFVEQQLEKKSIAKVSTPFKIPTPVLYYLTDCNFNSQVVKGFTRIRTSIEALEDAFEEQGFSKPLSVFHNLASTTRIPVKSNFPGVICKGGNHQSGIMGVLAGDFNSDEDSKKIKINSIDAFKKVLEDPAYDEISSIVFEVGEGCFGLLSKSESST